MELRVDVEIPSDVTGHLLRTPAALVSAAKAGWRLGREMNPEERVFPDTEPDTEPSDAEPR
jgi:hypothetical protein